MIPFYLITGFLGSGKTSFLQNLLKSQPERGRTAVIQNEFAPNSIDGQEIRRIAPGIEVVEINNGSVFCACLLGNFIETLNQLIERYKPDCIFLEASGLSDPGTLMQIIGDKQLQNKAYLAGSVCLVDALNFSKALQKMPRVIQQIRVADLVLLNKTDLVDRPIIEKTEDQIKKLNPLAEIIQTTFGQVKGSFWEKQPGNLLSKPLYQLSGLSEGRPNIQSAVLKSSKKMNAEKVALFLDELSLLAIRAKGYILLSNNEAILFQSVFGEYTCQAYPNFAGNTEFTAIGESIGPRKLHEVYSNYLG